MTPEHFTILAGYGNHRTNLGTRENQYPVIACQVDVSREAGFTALGFSDRADGLEQSGI